MQGITVTHCPNAFVREYVTDVEMSNFQIVPFHYDYARYDTGDSRFEQIGPTGERIIKRIFADTQLVRILFIQPNKLTVELRKEKANPDDDWDEVEAQVLEILDDILYRSFQSY